MDKINVPTGKTCSACKGQIIEEFKLKYEKIDSSRMKIGGRSPQPSFKLVSKFYCEDCGMNFNPTDKNGLKSFKHKDRIIDVLRSLDKPKVLLRDLITSEVSFQERCLVKLQQNLRVFIVEEETMSAYLGRASGRFFVENELELAELKKEMNGRFLVPGKNKATRFDVVRKWKDDFSKIQKEAYDEAMAMIKSGKTFKQANDYYKSKAKGSELHMSRSGIITSLRGKDKRPISYSYSIPKNPGTKKPKPPTGAIPAINVIVLDEKFKQHHCWIPKDAI